MMDIGMKVQILRACSSKKGNRCSSCPAFGHGDRNCIRNAMKDAATALSTLQAENETLRAEVENERAHRIHAEQHADAFQKDCERLNAELERVKAERDGAEKEITRLKAIMREKGIFTIPAKYPWEKPEWNL